MEVIKDARSERAKFGSLAEFIAHIEALPGTPQKDRIWAGGTYEESIRLSQQGWPEGAAKASALSERIAARTVSAAPIDVMEIGYETYGMSFDAGAVAQGIPECWLNYVPSGTKPEVRIVVNTSISACIDAEVMIRRGTAVAALALALQARGYLITIDVGGQGQFGGTFRSVYIRVADAASGSILDVDRIVYAIAHPTFFRLLIHYYFSGTKNYCGGHMPNDDTPPDANLFIGCVHMRDVERWQDGGEAWVLAEYKRQTQEAT